MERELLIVFSALSAAILIMALWRTTKVGKGGAIFYPTLTPKFVYIFHVNTFLLLIAIAFFMLGFDIASSIVFDLVLSIQGTAGLWTHARGIIEASWRER